MATAIKAKRTPASEHRATRDVAGVFAGLARACKALVDPYRPELHYMRGPGPKWHAKHDPAPKSVDAAAVPATVRCKAR